MELSLFEKIGFWIGSVWIMPLWILMIAFPKHSVSKKILYTPWCLAPIGVAYAILVISEIPSLLLAFATNIPTPNFVIALFSDTRAITLGWLHLLIFDLFVGRWIWIKVLEKDLPLQVSAPMLLTSMMFGVLGFLIALIVFEPLPTRKMKTEINHQ